jgi:hypothetical protein
LPLQRKTKPARFIHRVYFPGLALELACPVQERLLLESLRRLGPRSHRHTNQMN